jgi:hypothetical protein
MEVFNSVMGAGFIRYESRPSGMYARHCIPKREGKKTFHLTTNLGRVIDKEKGIFRNREKGYFKYSLEGGFEKIPIDNEITCLSNYKPLTLDFGDAWIFNKILKLSGYEV